MEGKGNGENGERVKNSFLGTIVGKREVCKSGRKSGERVKNSLLGTIVERREFLDFLIKFRESVFCPCRGGMFDP
jgi:hypothetical protein